MCPSPTPTFSPECHRDPWHLQQLPGSQQEYRLDRLDPLQYHLTHSLLQQCPSTNPCHPGQRPTGQDQHPRCRPTARLERPELLPLPGHPFCLGSCWQTEICSSCPESTFFNNFGCHLLQGCLPPVRSIGWVGSISAQRIVEWCRGERGLLELERVYSVSQGHRSRVAPGHVLHPRRWIHKVRTT